jgi:uncharacterized protein involved in response to NO
MNRLAPYQVFFPLGLLNAILAVGVWFFQNMGWFESPAILIHSKLIAGGFLWSFIVGFLMTAVPRMTGTASANKMEYAIASMLMLGQTLFAWEVDGRFFYSNQIMLILFLLIYGGRRVLKMTKSPPIFFSHVAFAMLMALAGSYFHFAGNSTMGIHLYHVGTTLLLVLGIGTRFFSFLSGLQPALENVNEKWVRFLFHGSGALIAVLLFCAGQGVKHAYLGLAFISLVYLFKFWKIQRRSGRASALKIAVRIVAATIPLSFFLSWLQPELLIAWLHILFIGCFALITFAVATRVTLAHGAYSTELETMSPALWYLVGFLVLGIVSRVFYGYSGGLWRTSWLHLAGTFWLLAVACWCWSFLPKIFKPGPMAKPSC